MYKRMLIALAALGTATGLNAADTLGDAERLSRTLTLYQQDLALFEERYRLPDNARDLSLRIDGIGPRMQTDSLLAQGIGTLTRVQLVNAPSGFQQQLSTRLGKSILLLSDRGEQREVTLLGVEGNGVLVSDGQRSELIPAGGYWRPALDQVLPVATPPYLKLDARGKAERELSLSYLSNGLSWQAGYQLMLAPHAGTLRLHGMATLHNNSGLDLEQVKVRLLAGSVNQPRNVSRPYAMEAMALRADSAAPTREALQDYHLYTPPEPVTLGNGQQVAIPLQAPIEMPVTNHYRYTQHVSAGSQYPVQSGHPRREISFTLPADKARKTPLPAGAARVFVQDKAQGLVFIGGQQLPATAAGETVTLTLGEAFDLTLEQQQTRYERQGNSTVVGYRIRIHNSHDEPRTLELDALFSQPRTLLDSSHKSDAQGPAQRWLIEVAGNSEETLEYSVRLHP